MAKKRIEQPYSIRRAGEFLEVSRATLYRLIREHGIRTFKIGRKTYVSDAEMQRLLAKLNK
jgi:excisionase family DNA binding protein